MLSERFQLKLFLEPSSHVELDAVIPVFHRFIRDQVIKELLIDVVDYSHVPDGPGVVLIGHSSDYYVGALDRVQGLVYSRKRGAPSPESRLEDALRRLVNGARLLEQEAELGVRFRTNHFSLRLTDRLRAPNDAATFESVKAEVEQLFGRIYGSSVSVERLATPREPLGLRIETNSSPALESLLEKLGGPPGA